MLRGLSLKKPEKPAQSELGCVYPNSAPSGIDVNLDGKTSMPLTSAVVPKGRLWRTRRRTKRGHPHVRQCGGAVGVLRGRVELAVPRRPRLPHQRGGEDEPPLGGQAVPRRAGSGIAGTTPTRSARTVFDNQHEIIGMYLAANWRAFRTWGVSAISPWEHDFFWSLRQGVDKSRKQLAGRLGGPPAARLQPGLHRRTVRTHGPRLPAAPIGSRPPTGRPSLRNNMPLLAYIAGKPDAFTSKDHNFCPGETVEKQIIIINNSRETVTADCRWSLGPARDRRAAVQRKPTHCHRTTGAHPAALRAACRNADAGAVRAQRRSELQQRRGAEGQLHDPRACRKSEPRAARRRLGKVACFDPKGETAAAAEQRWRSKPSRSRPAPTFPATTSLSWARAR